VNAFKGNHHFDALLHFVEHTIDLVWEEQTSGNSEMVTTCCF